MSEWSWDSSLSVGIDAVDNQHRRIVDYINELAAARRNKDRDKVTEILMALVDYANTHFAFEEALMREVGYPLVEPHKKIHDAFVVHLRRYLEQHESGQDVSRKLMSELQIWLTNHIKTHDQDYAPYVAKTLGKSWIKRAVGRFFG